MLNDGVLNKFDLKLMVNDENFDNEDNPYGHFIYHMYTNMDNLTDIEQNDTIANKNLDEWYDKNIPLVECQNQEVDVSWRDSRIKKYCPDYGDWAFIYGTFYTKRYSRLRLALHFCEDNPEAEEERRVQGKKHLKCKSKDESMDYFGYNIIGLDIFTLSPTLGNTEDEPLGKETTSLHYSVNV